ncbi:DUF2268 domain-containing putative Zn-dependent protease [Cytobacillus praedii]|uniref:DUF2268 domain-containing putative Zn-dependent protease n=1 Tax=Cytobacillus praedii TaxID=1742358 RepID=UPI002E23B1FF|nr:DUF2268 domain-containing putative Zn-dependent protease [Cytobacillus praedii]MED3575751.1 DUF2268 domain-containing putative Zn-dependent protease [Cytobacillus praedii]
MKYLTNISFYIYISMILLTVTMLASCEQKETSSINDQKEMKEQQISEELFESFNNSQTGQTDKIVNVYKLFSNYIDVMEKNPEASQIDTYKKEVLDPIYNDCFQDAEYIHMADSLLNEAPTRYTELKKIIKKLEKEATNKLIKEALEKSASYLPSEKVTTVCVFPATNSNYAMINVGVGKIIVLYDMYYTEGKIQAGIAHEYHHSVWTEKYLRRALPLSVLDNVIFEGKAVVFEKLVYPEISFTPINMDYNKAYWSKIEPDFDIYDINRSFEIIMGGKELPPLYGYSEGYKMVKSYLDLNPNATIEEWTAMSGKDIFQKGKYAEKYK